MKTTQAKALKVGDKVQWESLDRTVIEKGTVAVVHGSRFSILYDDGNEFTYKSDDAHSVDRIMRR